MKTAVEFLISEGCQPENDKNGYLWFKNVRALDLISFAKLHVTEALKQASEKANLKLRDNYLKLDMMDDWNDIDKDSILNAYPLDQIK